MLSKIFFFYNYLSRRTQYVDYLGFSSYNLPIKMGVPEGSIYINDLPSASDMFSILIYADDTILFWNVDNKCNEEVINAELNNVYSWL